MELLISETVARVLLLLYRDVNDAVQKAFIFLRGNIWQKTEYSINPQMTSNTTKSITNDMHHIKREAIS